MVGGNLMEKEIGCCMYCQVRSIRSVVAQRISCARNFAYSWTQLSGDFVQGRRTYISWRKMELSLK